MSRLFYHTMQDNAGNLLFDVSGTMRLAGTGTLATIYGDEALTVILANPMTNHPSFGSFKCFLGAGDYDFYLAKSGYTFETLTGVQGHGTMAQQDAANVAITGGSAVGLTQVSSQQFSVPNVAGSNLFAFFSDLMEAGGTTRYFLRGGGDAESLLSGRLGLGVNAPANYQAALGFLNGTRHGLKVKHLGNDTGGTYAMSFHNVADGTVGTIFTTGTTTAYNTSSDARLKHDVDDLTGELALIQALRPVSFRWNADESPGVGFLAHEVAAHVQGVITGEQDAVDEAGGILAQQIDYSKLVPFLVGAIKTLAARVAVLEDALGV